MRLLKLNTDVGAMIPGTYQIFLIADSVDEAEVNDLIYPVELPNSIAGSALLPDHTLTLIKGYVFMLLRNLQPKKGHVNDQQRFIFADRNKEQQRQASYPSKNTLRAWRRRLSDTRLQTDLFSCSDLCRNHDQLSARPIIHWRNWH